MNSLADALAEVVTLFESAQHELVFLVPPSVFSIAGAAYGTAPRAKQFIQNGGVMRGITTVSPANVEETRMRLAMGEDLRHSDLHYEIFMIVGDKQQSLSAINIGVNDYTLDTPLIAFRSGDPTYAEYLLTSFENAWSQSIPAEQRIQELLNKGAGQH
ncbi:MAG: hypothetical protein ACXV5D_06385 [Halobacteriota archaeon]